MINNSETSSTNTPIGVFDSGYGGLTVLKEIVSRLPQYDFVYLGDNARTPYGNRSFETVYEYTLQCVKKLFDLNCPLVILACNTASAKALRTIQQKDLPIIAPNNRVLGVIRPTAEIVGNISKTGKVGVLGTAGTVKSDSYKIEIEKFFPNIAVYQEACPMWVPLVENNELQGKGTEFFIEKNIRNLFEQNANIDTVILGCTHYPLLMPVIEKYMPKNVSILSQGSLVADSLKDYLFRHPEMEVRLSKNNSITYYTTDAIESFNSAAGLFAGTSVLSKHLDIK